MDGNDALPTNDRSGRHITINMSLREPVMYFHTGVTVIWRDAKQGAACSRWSFHRQAAQHRRPPAKSRPCGLQSKRGAHRVARIGGVNPYAGITEVSFNWGKL